MFPGGHCPNVGLGGFLLEGGMGLVCRVSEGLHTAADDCSSWFLIYIAELGLGMSICQSYRRSDCRKSVAAL